MYLLRTPRSGRLCVSPTVLIALLSITCSAEATPLRDGGLKRGLGANGNLVIHIAGAPGATCKLEHLIISTNASADCTVGGYFTLDSQIGAEKVLTAGRDYHLSELAVYDAFFYYDCSPIQSAPFYVNRATCLTPDSTFSLLGTGASWLLTCTIGGCYTTSGAVTLTIPSP